MLEMSNLEKTSIGFIMHRNHNLVDFLLTADNLLLVIVKIQTRK